MKDVRQQVKEATAQAVLESRCFCWITQPFDVYVVSEPRKRVVIDSTGILFRLYNGAV